MSVNLFQFRGFKFSSEKIENFGKKTLLLFSSGNFCGGFNGYLFLFPVEHYNLIFLLFVYFNLGKPMSSVIFSGNQIMQLWIS